MRRRLLVLLAIASIAAPVASKAAPPTPEPRVVPGVSKVIPAGKCVSESTFETGNAAAVDRWAQTGPYAACERLKVVFGPIWSKPGQNDVLIQPVTFEKPLYEGYITRFKPDLVGSDGTSPRVKDIHLHHGTWLNAGRSYGSGPWIASGEEKTIAVWPRGYGLNVQASDTWLFLHMIHNATPQTFPVWVTYDLDFIPKAEAESIADPVTGKSSITNTKGIWLDVGDCSWSSQCEKDTLNPIFNSQRGFGDGVCVFPNQNCAFQNTMATKSAQQGVELPNIYDDQTTISDDGTLVVMGGHVHFGGLADKVYLERDVNGDGKIDHTTDAAGSGPETKLITISDALYWDENFKPADWKPADNFDVSKNVVGGHPTSWDMVMTGVSKDIGWGIRVKKGDKLRIDGVYDTKTASWYEEMGIVMTWNAVGDTSGVDPFAEGVTVGQGLSTRAINPPTTSDYSLPGSEFAACTPSASVICARGQATHARVPSSGDHWTCELNGCPNTFTAATAGKAATDIHLGGFTYGEADIATVPVLGVPTVKVNTPVTFWNADTADYMWHTMTRCALPCSGTTSAAYPIPDGSYDDLIDPVTGKGEAGKTLNGTSVEGMTMDQLLTTFGPDPMDFDSGQLGYGTGANNKLSWAFTPTRTGTFAFFCRIHPSMRGAIRVVA